MRRVRNTHTASVAGIAPGAEGDVDETNHGVGIFLDARLLVPVEGTAADDVDTPRADDAMPSREDVERMLRELAARAERIARLTDALEEATRANADLDEQLRAATSQRDAAREALTAEQGAGNALRARVAELEAELDAATRPAAPLVDGEFPRSGRQTRKG